VPVDVLAPPGSGGRRAHLARELVREVDGLRPVLRDMVTEYEARLARQLAEVVGALTPESAFTTRPPPARTTSAMLRAIRSIELKPSRGRAKDLVQLQELVATLTEMLPSR
jgi:hypothetical protein